jgi:SAM-dependent methyltransferase
MGNEMSKAQARRAKDARYANRWFVGFGLDIGCGFDILTKSSDFPNIGDVVGYDSILGSGDAQYLLDIADNTFDFVVSSHCLEHMKAPDVALGNWLRVLKPGGYLVTTIPEQDMYEHRHWPSRFNGDHKWSWTMKAASVRGTGDHVIYLPSFLQSFADNCDIEMLQLLTEHYDFGLADNIDQTGGLAECALEFVLRKN